MENENYELDSVARRHAEEERAAREKKLRTTMYVMAGVAAVLALALAWIWYQKSSLVGDLQEEKEELTAQIETLRNDYASLSSDYDSINAQLDSSREEVNQLVERIKKTDATNRAMIRKYQKELGTLRSIMRNYIVQIDSLNTLNKKLTAEAADARREASESKKQNEELSQQVENLSGRVAAGAVLKATGIHLSAQNKKGETVDRSSRAARLYTSLKLVENDLAERGPVRVYVIVKDPDGQILTNANSPTFSFRGEAMMASASREVDYEGQEVALGIYLNDIAEFKKGAYTAEAYTTQSALGSATLMLR